MLPCLLDWWDWPATTESLLRSPVLRANARPLVAAAISLIVTYGLGHAAIKWLRRWQVLPGESASPTLNRMHEHKRSTPTMGGLFVVAGILGSIALVADWSQPLIGAAQFTLVGFAGLGAIDDLAKCRGARRGLTVAQKLVGQLAIAAVVAYWLRDATGIAPAWIVIAWILATSNAVNLSDGLDGLAAGCLVVAAIAVGILTAAGEARILAAALAGGALGFLPFNRRPARVFLGDSGALPLGALLAVVVLASGRPWICLLIMGVFLAELVSVVLQVGSFKLTGKRVFRCAPLHHHFQFAGWNEQTIVRRFWGAAGVCALCGILAAGDLPTGFISRTQAEHTGFSGAANQITQAELRIKTRAASPSHAKPDRTFSRSSASNF